MCRTNCRFPVENFVDYRAELFRTVREILNWQPTTDCSIGLCCFYYLIVVDIFIVDKRLTTQAKIFKKFSILLNVSISDVIKHSSTTTNHHQQSTTWVVVFDMALKMLGETVDSFSEKCNLYFRWARVCRVLSMLADDIFSWSDRHFEFAFRSLTSRFASQRDNWSPQPFGQRHLIRGWALIDPFNLRHILGETTHRYPKFSTH